MVLSFTIALLALIVSATALWLAHDISAKSLHQGRELVNNHLIDHARKSNSQNDEVLRLKRKINMIDAELQTYRQEFRKILNAQGDQINDLTAFRQAIESRVKPGLNNNMN